MSEKPLAQVKWIEIEPGLYKLLPSEIMILGRSKIKADRNWLDAHIGEALIGKYEAGYFVPMYTEDYYLNFIKKRNKYRISKNI
jgi:hypothetical protein